MFVSTLTEMQMSYFSVTKEASILVMLNQR